MALKELRHHRCKARLRLHTKKNRPLLFSSGNMPKDIAIFCQIIYATLSATGATIHKNASSLARNARATTKMNSLLHVWLDADF